MHTLPRCEEYLPSGFKILTAAQYVLLVLVFHFCAGSIRSQDTVTRAFEGNVTNSQTGEALKGATVEILNQQTGLIIRTETDYRGRFYQGLLIES